MKEKIMEYDNITLKEAITLLKEKDKKIAALNRRVSESSWETNPDKMGGSFTEEEINRTRWK